MRSHFITSDELIADHLFRTSAFNTRRTFHSSNELVVNYELEKQPFVRRPLWKILRRINRIYIKINELHSHYSFTHRGRRCRFQTAASFSIWSLSPCISFVPVQPRRYKGRGFCSNSLVRFFLFMLSNQIETVSFSYARFKHLSKHFKHFFVWKFQRFISNFFQNIYHLHFVCIRTVVFIIHSCINDQINSNVLHVVLKIALYANTGWVRLINGILAKYLNQI